MCLAWVGLLPSGSWATTIDLMGVGHPSYNNTAGFSVNLAGLVVTFSTGTGVFSYNVFDGLGVKSSYEGDEIERPEVVTITFSQPVRIDSLYVTDLFRECRGSHCYNEMGSYTLGSTTATFLAPDTNGSSTNGTMSVPVSWLVTPGESFTLTAPGYVYVSTLLSKGRVTTSREDHEFSLGMLVFTPQPPAPIPEPETLFSIGVGLAALVIARRFGSTSI